MARDAQLFVCLATVLVAIGIVMAHSASMTSHPTDKDEHHLARQASYLGVGLVAATAAALVPPAVWPRVAPWFFAATALLLAVVLVPGIGTEVNGARRWLRFGPISVQPSELAKLALPMFTARLAIERRDRLRGWISGTIPILWPAAIVLPLVLIEPDLGTTLFLAAGTALLMFLAGWPLRNFFLGAAFAVPALVALVALKPYQLQRVTGFIAAWTDPASAPYQVRQSLITLGSGGLMGTGLGRGWQKLSFLPEASTDFVFAVLGEELGLLGTVGLVAVWVGLTIAGLKLLAPLVRDESAKTRYAFLCGITLLFQLTGQAFINMAVVTALLPPKGIALPLVSYGGSNLVTSLIAIGLILSFSRAAESVGAARE
jgi:cell division protein FtsW